MWEGWEGCTRSPPGLRTTAPRIDGTRARFPRFPHPPPPLRRCLWEGWEGRPRPHPPAAPGPSHSERARARFPRFPQDPTAIPAALRPTDPWHNAPRRRQAAEKTKNGCKPAGCGLAASQTSPVLPPLHSHGESTGRTGRRSLASAPSELSASRRDCISTANSQRSAQSSRWGLSAGCAIQVRRMARGSLASRRVIPA